jgi:hypothetical protein
MWLKMKLLYILLLYALFIIYVSTIYILQGIYKSMYFMGNLRDFSRVILTICNSVFYVLSLECNPLIPLNFIGSTD